MASKTSKAKLVKAMLRDLLSVSQAKQTPPQRRARKGRSRRQAKRENAGVNLQGSRMSYQAEPVAEDYTLSNPTMMRISGAVNHADFGSGVRIEGRQLLTDVTTTGSNNTVFTGTGLATVGTNWVQLSPDILNGRLALQARNYARYAFRRVKLSYIPRVATSDVGQFALGYVPDGSNDALATLNFSNVLSLSPCFLAPFRKTASLEVRYSGDMTWLTLVDTTSAASKRLTVQGEFLAAPDASGIGALTHGYIWIDYVIDLYGQSNDYAFTVSLKSAEEKEAVSKLVAKLRIADEDPDDWDTRSRGDASAAAGIQVRRRT